MGVAAIALLFSISAEAQVVIKIRPQAPTVVVERPAPRHGYYWREGEYRPKHKTYVYVGPRWIKEKRGRTWVGGHWAPARGGEIWVPGHWN